MSGLSPVVGVFAHPDDEAMGPAGTLALLARTRDVYLICVTDGHNGSDQSAVRRAELDKSAHLLGVKHVYHLDYRDGSLSNNLYHQVAGQIKTLLQQIRPDTLITFEPRGVSGHLDHIALSFICHYLFQHTRFIKKLMGFCRQASPLPTSGYFIYFPPGYRPHEVDEIVDVSSVWPQKLAAIRAHASQAHDVRRILTVLRLQPKQEYFLVTSRR